MFGMPMVNPLEDATTAMMVGLLNKEGDLPDYIQEQAKECDRRHEEARTTPHGHGCPSYVHCLISRIDGMIMPVCPRSVVRVWEEKIGNARKAGQQ